VVLSHCIGVFCSVRRVAEAEIVRRQKMDTVPVASRMITDDVIILSGVQIEIL
jgi:hypothetical protein